jgi:Uma2 family endonuclease
MMDKFEEPHVQYLAQKGYPNSKKQQVSLAEYLDMIADGTRRLEFRDGEVVDVQSATESHGLICTNIVGFLFRCLREKGCSIFAGDRENWVEACRKMYYPDILMVCEEHITKQMSENVRATINPQVVIEVLSSSTEHYDLTKKSRCYQTIESLEQILFVWQDEKLVKSLRRMDNRHDWIESFYEDDDEKVPVQNCEILMSDIYDRVIFPTIEGERVSER